MLKRKITQQLIDWKTSSEKAMLITGARQIGKSYAIREFAKQEYQTYVEINLYDNKAATKALLTASSMDDFLSRLSLFAQTDMIPGNTLIFIDEVQSVSPRSSSTRCWATSSTTPTPSGDASAHGSSSAA